MKLVGIFGGTFDPIHNAHLRLALEVKQAVGMNELRLMPAAIPPHKQPPMRGPQVRLQMLQLALSNCPELAIDSRELDRDGPSFTFDTLHSIRAELGSEVSLCLVMGADSFASFDRWYRWAEFLDLVNLVVIMRPGINKVFPESVSALLKLSSASLNHLRENPSGGIHLIQLSMLPISSTDIRQQISQGESPQFLLPDSVWSFIQKNNLYR